MQESAEASMSARMEGTPLHWRPRTHATQASPRDRRLAWVGVLLLHAGVVLFLRIPPPEREPSPEDRIEIVLVSPEPVGPYLEPERAPTPADRAQASLPSRGAPASRALQAVEVPAPAGEQAPDPLQPNTATFHLLGPDGRLLIDHDLAQRAGEAVEEVVEWRIAYLDQVGEFLRPLPSIDYEPTRFEAYWVPTESVLEEWVRRGIKEVYIPIPGSSWRIQCTVSLLAPGGGCGIVPPHQDSSPQPLAPYVPPPNWSR